MRSLIALAFSLALAGSAQALPAGPLQTPTDVIQVAGGCGPGWHRGPHGRCIRNVVVPRRACPRGYHLGPHGRCRPNW